MISKRIAVISIFLALCGCTRPKDVGEETSATNACVPVRISQLNKGNIEALVTATGITDALRKEKIFSPLAGRVISLKVLEGSPVQAGDVMLILRTKEAQAAMEGAQALVRNAVTDRQIQEARRALALVDSLQPQIVVRAPFNGIVASRSVTEGERVGEQAEMITIIDPTTIVFVADVPINSIAAIHPNLPARISFQQLPNIQIDAVVEAVNPQAEEQSQSVKVRLRFCNLTDAQQKTLKSNMPGTVYIITGIRHDVFVVNRSVLLHDDEEDKYSLVIMTDDSLAKIVPVTVGIQTESLVEVKSDLLHAGTNVISEGQYALTDSMRVTVER